MNELFKELLEDEWYLETPIKREYAKDVFVEFILPDGNDHVITVTIEKDGPLFRELIKDETISPRT